MPCCSASVAAGPRSWISHQPPSCKTAWIAAPQGASPWDGAPSAWPPSRRIGPRSVRRRRSPPRSGRRSQTPCRPAPYNGGPNRSMDAWTLRTSTMSVPRRSAGSAMRDGRGGGHGQIRATCSRGRDWPVPCRPRRSATHRKHLICAPVRHCREHKLTSGLLRTLINEARPNDVSYRCSRKC